MMTPLPVPLSLDNMLENSLKLISPHLLPKIPHVPQNLIPLKRKRVYDAFPILHQSQPEPDLLFRILKQSSRKKTSRPRSFQRALQNPKDFFLKTFKNL